MIILAIDTALDACSAALVEDGRTLASRSEPMQRGHQERLAPLVAELLSRAAVAPARLDRIAVTVGPGSFTGVRVGLAFAKGLSLALDVPCLGIGTLEALAAGRHGPVAAVLDARRGEVYVQAFRDGAALEPPEGLSLVDAAARLCSFGPAFRLVGSGAALLASLTPGAVIEPASLVDPAAVARLAQGRLASGERPRPEYMRKPDALTLAQRAAPGAAG